MLEIYSIYTKPKQIEFIGCLLLSNIENQYTTRVLLANSTRVDIRYLRVLAKYSFNNINSEYTYIRYIVVKR